MDQLRVGEERFQQGRLAEARTCFQQVLADRPADVRALTNLGVVCFQLGDAPSAERALGKALEVDENASNALASLAEVYRRTGRPAEAADCLRRYLRVCPDDDDARRKLEALSPCLRSHPGGHEGWTPAERADRAGRLAAGPIDRPWRASHVGMDITPSDYGARRLQGFAGQVRMGEQLLSPLTGQLLLLEDPAGARVLIMAADLFGFGRELTAALRDKLRPWGLGPEAIVLNASHTHYGPGTVSHVPELLGPMDSQYVELLCGALDQAIPVLFDRLEACLLYAGQVEACIGSNRRVVTEAGVSMGVNAEGAYDRATGVLCVDLPGSGRSVVAVSHGCHLTSLNAAPVVFADVPHVLRQALSASLGGAEVMFLQGMAGSVKPTAPSADGREFSCRPADVQANGTALAAAVAQRIGRGLRPVEGGLRAQLETARLPLETPPPRQALHALADGPQVSGLDRAWARALIDGRADATRTELAVEVQTLRLGEQVAMTALAGEPVAELADGLRQAMPPADVQMLLGYTNGLEAYLPTDRIVREGGYEGAGAKTVYLLPAPFAQGVEQRLRDAVSAGAAAVADQGRLDVLGRRHELGVDRPAFFCLSSGRCGTMSLARALDLADNARVYHHPQPMLVAETGQVWQGRLDPAEVFWNARRGVIQDAWKDDLVFGELDMNMTPFAPTLARELPAAKFLLLVRSPFDFVRSGMRRGYYVGHPWDVGRLTPRPGTPEAQAFASWDPFRKVCWLWKETYQRILAFSQPIGADRVRLVRFEDVIANPGRLEGVYEFLGLTGFDESAIEDVMARKLNRQTGGDFPPPTEWPDRLIEVLWEVCGPVASRLGYARSPADPIASPPAEAVGQA